MLPLDAPCLSPLSLMIANIGKLEDLACRFLDGVTNDPYTAADLVFKLSSAFPCAFNVDGESSCVARRLFSSSCSANNCSWRSVMSERIWVRYEMLRAWEGRLWERSAEDAA